MLRRVPRWLTAELTYRCPLSCFYCSNPLRMEKGRELSTAEWVDVFGQARALGAVQLGLTGGEPLLRPDLTTLVSEARSMGYYTNLITSAVGLRESRLAALRDAGLDSVQISFQAEQRELNDFIGGKRSFEQKKRMMHAVRALGLPLTLNVVIHRLNIDRMHEICEFCASMEPDHVELASVQFHGWAALNRSTLIPTPTQVERAQRAVDEYQRAHSGVYYVLPDLLQRTAKPCHQGWGSTYLCVNPQGDVTPCLSAHTLPSVRDAVPNVRDQRIESIWNGELFQRYAGLEWMVDQRARAHPRRRDDLGGCRCQAYHLTGDERAMDPVDASAAHHAQFCAELERSQSTPTRLDALVPRRIAPRDGCEGDRS